MIEEAVSKPLRYHLLDNLRGACMIYTIFYHALFNLSMLFVPCQKILFSVPITILRDVVAATFIFIAGISSYLTRSNLKRGTKALIAALLVTLATYVAMPEMTIIFGILHFFAFAMLLFSAIKPLFEKIPSFIGLPIFILLYVLTRSLYEMDLGTPDNFLMFALGFKTSILSGDYYPIMPHIFMFFTGCFAGRLFKERKAPRIFEKNPIPPLASIGRHTMLIYLAHQPILFGALIIIAYFIR